MEMSKEVRDLLEKLHDDFDPVGCDSCGVVDAGLMGQVRMALDAPAPQPATSADDVGPWGLWHPTKGWAYTSELHLLLAYENKQDAEDLCSSRHGHTVRSFAEAAVEAEKARCAKIAKAERRKYMGPQGASMVSMEMNHRCAEVASNIAASIRAGDTP